MDCFYWAYYFEYLWNVSVSRKTASQTWEVLTVPPCFKPVLLLVTQLTPFTWSMYTRKKELRLPHLYLHQSCSFVSGKFNITALFIFWSDRILELHVTSALDLSNMLLQTPLSIACVTIATPETRREHQNRQELFSHFMIHERQFLNFPRKFSKEFKKQLLSSWLWGTFITTQG